MEDHCVCCGETILECRQVCRKYENETQISHCVICGKEISWPKFSFGGRQDGKTMMRFWYNMRQLCCSDGCFGEWIEEIRRELNG